MNPSPTLAIKLASSIALQHYLARPEVQTYIKAKEEEKQRKEHAKSWKLPTIGAGLLAGGYGLKRLGDAAFSPEDRKSVDDFVSLQSQLGSTIPGEKAFAVFDSRNMAPSIAKSPELFFNYIDRASKAIGVKPYGKPALPMIHKVKDMILGPEKPHDFSSMTPAEAESARESDNHYPAFVAGPVPAFRHQIRKLLVDPSWDDRSKVPDVKEHFLWNKELGEPHMDTADYRAKFEYTFDDYLKNRWGVNNADEAASKFNHGQQMDIIRRFNEYAYAKNPELAKGTDMIERHLAKNQPNATNAYSNVAGAATNLLQDIPRAVGYGSMALGGGLLGAWGINKYLESKRKKEKLKAPGADTLHLTEKAGSFLELLKPLRALPKIAIT